MAVRAECVEVGAPSGRLQRFHLQGAPSKKAAFPGRRPSFGPLVDVEESEIYVKLSDYGQQCDRRDSELVVL